MASSSTGTPLADRLADQAGGSCSSDVRYIELDISANSSVTSTGRKSRRSRARGDGDAGRRLGGCRTAGAIGVRRALHLPPCRASRDYALARRAVLRDLRARRARPASTSATPTPSSSGPARHVGEPRRRRVPGLRPDRTSGSSPTSTATSSSRPTGGASARRPSSQKLGRVARRVRLLRRRGLRRLPLEPPRRQSLHGRCTRPPSRRRLTFGYCERTRCTALGSGRPSRPRVPARDDVDPPDRHELASGRRSSRTPVARRGSRRSRLRCVAAGSRACPGRRRSR